MDWVIWTIGGIVLIGFVVGMYRGALRIAVSIVTTVVTIFIAFYATPYVAQILEEKTPMDEVVKKHVESSIENVSDLPEVFEDLLTKNNNDETYHKLGVGTFAQYVGAYLSKLIIRIVSFLVLFLLVTIVLRAIVFALNVVNKIRAFGFVNRMAGGVAGAICSLIVVWFLLVVVTLLYTTDTGKQIYDTIRANPYTNIIYENNPLLKMLIKF